MTQRPAAYGRPPPASASLPFRSRRYPFVYIYGLFSPLGQAANRADVSDAHLTPRPPALTPGQWTYPGRMEWFRNAGSRTAVARSPAPARSVPTQGPARSVFTRPPRLTEHLSHLSRIRLQVNPCLPRSDSCVPGSTKQALGSSAGWAAPHWVPWTTHVSSLDPFPCACVGLG